MQEVANPKPYGKKNGFYHDYTNISDFPAGGSKNETVPPNHEGSKPAVSSHRSHRNYTVAVGKRIGVYRINENYNKTEPNLDLTEEYGDGAATKLTEFDKLDKQKSLVSISTVSSGTTETVRTSSSFNNFSSSVSTKRNTTTQRVEVNGDSFLQVFFRCFLLNSFEQVNFEKIWKNKGDSKLKFTFKTVPSEKNLKFDLC